MFCCSATALQPVPVIIIKAIRKQGIKFVLLVNVDVIIFVNFYVVNNELKKRKIFRPDAFMEAGVLSAFAVPKDCPALIASYEQVRHTMLPVK
jgi:hypothetical protein